MKRIPKSRYNYCLLLGLLWLLSGCGFQLRGTYGFKVNSVYVESQSADRTAAEVRRILIDQGVTVPPTAQAAQVVLRISNEITEKRVLSVSAVSGKIQEVELNLRVETEAHKPDGKVLQPQQLISLLRDYSFDETAVLAMGAEEEALRNDMFRESVEQVLRRLRAVSPNG